MLLISHFHSRDLLMVIIGVLITLPFFLVCTNDSDTISDKEKAILKHISIGMDIDEAVRVLKVKGFPVHDKYKPTEDGDYWVVNVTLIDEITFWDTVGYVTGISKGRKRYLIIEANTDGVITSID